MRNRILKEGYAQNDDTQVRHCRDDAANREQTKKDKILVLLIHGIPYPEKLGSRSVMPEAEVLGETRRQEEDGAKSKPKGGFCDILPHYKLDDLLL